MRYGARLSSFRQDKSNPGEKTTVLLTLVNADIGPSAELEVLLQHVGRGTPGSLRSWNCRDRELEDTG